MRMVLMRTAVAALALGSGRASAQAVMACGPTADEPVPSCAVLFGSPAPAEPPPWSGLGPDDVPMAHGFVLRDDANPLGPPNGGYPFLRGPYYGDFGYGGY